MEQTEILISGIGISKSVIGTVVTSAVNKVEGVARVGGNDITSSLISVFTSKTVQSGRAVECESDEHGLIVTVHLAVFFGYTFTKLAEQVRIAASQAITEQIGVNVSAVNVCIDSLVFPKE
ncbi:Asp23/Gls24 family envelope stress response protein [Atopobium fossor]|uniref:Asp23/Gls24 family envelope stress response protein n=1 Tax=Atopobium fossor TaxID=39487 RepID=UPI0004284AD1|nr:Asp23/Gls24 family envelope stress response protein [Atopobium fossor]